MGQSAAGKETFINYAVNNPDCELMRTLGFAGSNIIPVLGYNEAEIDRKIAFILDVTKKETNAVVLIKFQHYDTGYNFADSVMSKLKSLTPDISNEIICLSVESDVLYARLPNKPWFDEKEAANFSQEQMNHVVEIMRNNVKNYLTIGFKLAAEIDATNGYKIIENSLLKIK